MPSTFLMLFSVLVVNESVMVIGLYKVIKGRLVIDLAALSAVSLDLGLDLLQDDVNDSFVGNLFRLKYFLVCWCRCRESKS